MIIQFNADKNLTIHEEFSVKLSDHLRERLNRFMGNISRLDVHFTDDNGNKQGPDDKKCMMEARVEGRPPIHVTATGDNYELACDAALQKLRSSLERLFDKFKH